MLAKQTFFLSLTLWCFFFFHTKTSSAQCDAIVPNFTVDLSSNPDSAWISTDVIRQGNCCGTIAPDVCISFTVTLSPNAQGIRFDVCDGAMPGGSLFYQLNCGPPSPVGELICLNGVGPHTITFCKPGNNLNKYCITSISDPEAGADLAVNDGCMDTLSATGFADTSISWNSIYPGTEGAYNYLLSCTQDCDTTIVTGAGGLPAYIDYQVCGYPIGGCGTALICDTQRVTFYTTLNVDILPENPTVCYGTTSANITANASGGKPPYLYNWNTGESTPSISVGVGTYIVAVSDSSGCPPTYDTVTVTAFANPIQAFAGKDTVLCSQNSIATLNGSVIAATGGKWIGGSGLFSPDRNSLIASYDPTPAEINNGYLDLILETTGNGSCPPDQDTIRLKFSEYSATETIVTTMVSCKNGSDGTASISINGTDPPYTFIWDANTGGQSSSTANNLSAGTYNVTVTDALGCDSVYSVTILEPDSLLSNISSNISASCFNGNDGSATVSAVGGTSPYSYQWSNSQTTQKANNLSAGSYSVTVTDANGCTSINTATISEPTQLSSSFTSSSSVSCFGGSDGTATVLASGGTAPYTYQWSNNQTTQTASNLSAGTHSVSITDANGCILTNSVLITEPTVLNTSVNIVQNALCAGTNTGSATVTASGGTAPYSYLWSNSQASATATGLAAGKHFVLVTDANGCSRTDSIIITEPNYLSSAISSKSDVSCYNGSDGNAMVTASGGTTPYSYQWSNSAQTSTITNLAAGKYLVTITDANNCSLIDSVLINQPDSLYSNFISVIDASCLGFDDGSAEVQPIGGTPPYTYQWSDNQVTNKAENLAAGLYSIVITDANGCITVNSTRVSEPDAIELQLENSDTICVNENILITANTSGGNGVYIYQWDNSFSTGPTISVSPQQTTFYSVSVTDQNNCPGELDSIQIVVRNIYQDSISVISTDSICKGESAQVMGFHQGENGPFSYSWNAGFTGFGPHTVQPTASTTYVLKVTDVCNNSISDSARIIVSEPPPLNLKDTIAKGCEALTVAFDNNTGGSYTYIWDFGDGQRSNEISPTHTYDAAGTYAISLSIKSREGCISKTSAKPKVIVWPTPDAIFSADPLEAKIEYPYIDFYTTLSDAIDWTWYFGDGDSAKVGIPRIESFVEHKYSDTGSYRVRLWKKNQFGCTDTFERVIIIGPSYTFKVPNAFTPNPNSQGGGFYNPASYNNDVFYPFTQYVEQFHMMIFNRWGEVVFESKDINYGWDGYYKGKLCQQDVYVYKIVIKHTDGEKIVKVGTLTLLR